MADGLSTRPEHEVVSEKRVPATTSCGINYEVTYLTYANGERAVINAPYIPEILKNRIVYVDDNPRDPNQRKGDWIQTFTGKQFFPLDAREEDIDIIDIAHSLSMQCRYNGHVQKFYSVAEHCCWVASFAPERYKLEALLHDASEAYICDVPRPLKPYLSNYKEIEGNLETVIAKKFKLEYPWPEIVKELDARILIDEKAHLMGEEPAPWNLVGEPLGIKHMGWSPEAAKESFMQLYHRYKKR